MLLSLLHEQSTQPFASWCLTRYYNLLAPEIHALRPNRARNYYIHSRHWRWDMRRDEVNALCVAGACAVLRVTAWGKGSKVEFVEAVDA